MNGFKFLAVGAFFCCGQSVSLAQISILENQPEPRSILVNSGDENAYQPAESNLRRDRAEISGDEIVSPFNSLIPSPSDQLNDKAVDGTTSGDPAALPVGIHHRHNPIDQILHNGLITQTLNSAQAPIAWPMQGVDNPTARMMMNSGCTGGLWASYPAERAAECALMYQRLAGNTRCQGCGGHGCSGHGCGSCNAGCSQGNASRAHFQPVNRYAPATCDGASSFIPASHSQAQQPQFKSLLAPTPTVAAPLSKDAVGETPVTQENVTQDNVAQLPGLFR